MALEEGLVEAAFVQVSPASLFEEFQIPGVIHMTEPILMVAANADLCLCLHLASLLHVGLETVLPGRYERQPEQQVVKSPPQEDYGHALD